MDEDAKKWMWWAIPVAVVVVAGGALYYARQHREGPPVQPTQQTTAAPSTDSPGIQHPIEADTGANQPLPTLEESDTPLQDDLLGVFGRPVEQVLVPKNIIRHTVVTIDNLTRKKTAVQMWPVKPTSGELGVEDNAGEIVLSESNFQRYEPVMTVIRRTDPQQVAALYRRYYPLFQQAYVDLGYPNGYFNDRLVEVIDHLLATPDVSGPIRLTQPGVFYEFADASLEERSAGQKLLIRMGPKNAAEVKEKLRALRTAVASQQR